MQILSAFIRYERSSDRTTNEGSYRYHSKQSSRSEPDLSYVADLGDERWDYGDVGAR